MDLKVGDIVHIKGRVLGIGPAVAEVEFNFARHSFLINRTEITHHEPAPLKVGDMVLSKDGNIGQIRYIEDDWALVRHTGTNNRSIRFLCDLQRAPVRL
jgi:hypothetical protein